MSTSINFGIKGITPTGGDYYGQLQTVSISASGNYVVPMGCYYILPDANGTIQLNLNGTWTNVAGAGVGGLHFSDGASVRVLAGASASTTQIIPILYIV